MYKFQSYHDTEELLGKALKGRREKAFIFTGGAGKDVKSLMECCERSLKNFQTDYLDGLLSSWQMESKVFMKEPENFRNRGRFVSLV